MPSKSRCLFRPLDGEVMVVDPKPHGAGVIWIMGPSGPFSLYAAAEALEGVNGELVAGEPVRVTWQPGAFGLRAMKIEKIAEVGEE